MAEENFGIPEGNGNFDGATKKMPSAEELLAAIEKMSGLNEESKQELRDSILRGANVKDFVEPGKQVAGNNPMLEIWIVLVLVFFVFMILVFFGYKLYKSLVERERRREEKRKQKQQKKKK